MQQTPHNPKTYQFISSGDNSEFSYYILKHCKQTINVVKSPPSHCMHWDTHLEKVTKMSKKYKSVLVFIHYSNTPHKPVFLQITETSHYCEKSPRLRRQQLNLLVCISHYKNNNNKIYINEITTGKLHHLSPLSWLEFNIWVLQGDRDSQVRTDFKA